MSKYPVGPKIRSVDTFVRNVPVPPPLWLFFLLNGLALLAFSVMVVGLQLDNSHLFAANTPESVLVVISYFFLPVATIWSIVTNRSISRYFCIFGSGFIALATLLLTGMAMSSPILISIVSATLISSAMILLLSKTSVTYYGVLSGKLDLSEYQPFSLRTWKIADGFGTIMGYVGELFILFLAIFMVLRFIFHD